MGKWMQKQDLSNNWAQVPRLEVPRARGAPELRLRVAKQAQYSKLQ